MQFKRYLLPFIIAAFALSTCKDKGINSQRSPQGKVVFVMSDTIGVDDFGNPVPGPAIFRMNLDGARRIRWNSALTYSYRGGISERT
jgi:hypothetical protein